jgi:hypothetical protein
MMVSTAIATATSTTTDLRKDINNILKEWHFGTEDMFDNEDLECMTDDIMKIINKKCQLSQKQQPRKKRT